MRYLSLFLVVCLFVVNCTKNDDGDDGGELIIEPPEIAVTKISLYGRWISNFGDPYRIINRTWGTSFGNDSIYHFDEDNKILITYLDEFSSFNPDTFSKIVWTEIENEEFYFCTIAFNLPSLEEALADDTVADSTDPSTSGCGGFSWTKLIRRLNIIGSWENNTSAIEITSSSWKTILETETIESVRIVSYDNYDQTMVIQVSTDFSFTGGSDFTLDSDFYGKLLWTFGDNEELENSNELYYCVFALSLEISDVENRVPDVDFNGPSRGGCVLGAWSLVGVRR